MAEGAEIRKDLERAVGGPMLNSIWESLVEDRWLQMHEGGLLDEDPEASWDILKEETEKRIELVNRSLDEVSQEEMRLTEGTAYTKDQGAELSWAPHKEPSAKRKKKRERYEPELVAFLDFFLLLSPESAAMMRATSDFFERLASAHPDVVRFRSEVLMGEILTPNQAHALLGSYAARFFPHDWFLDWGIPIVGHTSEIVGEYRWSSPKDEVDHRVTVWVDPPGVAKSVRYAHPDTPMYEDPIPTSCVLRSGLVLPPYSAAFPTDEDNEATTPASEGHNMGPIEVGGFHTPTRPWYVWPGSVVDNLYALSEELADAFRWPGRAAAAEPFRWWRKDAAAEFVLTDIAPLMRPLEASMYTGRGYPGSRWQIELNISPWVSAEEVSRAYKRMQARVIEGNRNRLPDSKTLEVASFVWKQERLNRYQRPKWRVLCEQWNKEYSDQQFASWRQFRTYFERADKAVKELNFDWT